MAEEIQVISDGDGVAVLGAPGAVERFLDSIGLLSESKDLRLDRLAQVLDAGGETVSAVSQIVASSGRYVKLTKESAQLVRELGLMKTKTPGISHAMLGEPGRMRGWIQIEDGLTPHLTSPALLSGVGGLMTQLARQAEVAELRALLVVIDEKLDDVRRAQRDSVLAKMDRATLAIQEAMSIREHDGNRETAWGKVEAESGTILEVEASALRALDALADKVAGKRKVGELARATTDIEGELAVWLAVLARCFQLEDEYAVLEIDHVLDVAPADLDGHRLGLSAAQRERRDLIANRTRSLLDGMGRAGIFADSNVLLHVRKARSVVDSVNSTADLVDEFSAPLGIEIEKGSMEATRWRDALRDPLQLRSAATEAGQNTVTGLKVAGPISLMVFAYIRKTRSGSKGGE